MSHLRLFFVAACASVGWLAACATTSTDEMDSGAPDASGGEGGLNCGSATKCGLGAMAKCADLTKDKDNCGACGKKCSASQFCAGGKCSDQCNTPFKLCGQFCVDTDTDHENCGTCGKGCSVDQDCIGKACVKKCGLGLTPCGDTCANLATDHDFCGDCNNACGPDDICSGGLCCAAGQTTCMGQCVDLQFSSDNCGACGYACGGQTPYCVGGKCSNCNPTVLLLMDTGNAENQKLVQALNAAGLPATLVNNGIETYSNSPAASGYGAILVSGGSDYDAADMPNSGQAAVLAAQQKGTGIVFVEPIQYNYYYDNDLSTLQPLFLATGTDDGYAFDNTYPSLTKKTNHPIWNGVTAPLSTNPLDFIEGFQPTIANGATAIGDCTATDDFGICGLGGTILVKTPANAGRIVHFNVTINDSNYQWSSNAGIMKLLVNALGWATTCK